LLFHIAKTPRAKRGARTTIKGNSFLDYHDETSTSEIGPQQREGEGKKVFEMR